uniref:hypothetical protein n=1 Tax=Pedobacter schmidteae TaxID=2201271 RepID=UPI0018D542C0|nr:hypothetical protein [Pedobacter schmidteae]
MKLLMVILMLFADLPKTIHNDQNMDYIRVSYTKALSDKKLCKAMIEELDTKNGNNVYLAYLGAFKAIWAGHAINPIAKLNTFNKGKQHIEAAVKADPDNVEIRFIRLSIQKNCPSFLGYSNQIEQDTHFIHANRNSITSIQLKKMITEIIKK